MSKGTDRIDGSVEPSEMEDIIPIICGNLGNGGGKQPIKEYAFRRSVPTLMYESATPPTRGIVLLGNME